MPVIFLVITCAFWGLSFPVMKALHVEQAARLPQAGTLFLSAWMQIARFGSAALILLPFVACGARPTRLELRQGLWIAFWGGLGMGIQADGLAHTDASTSAFLTQAYCIFLPLWACLKHREVPGRRVLVATLLVIAGGAILSGIRLDHLRLGRGELETVIAAFLFTFQILILEDPKYASTRGMPVTFVMFVSITVMFVPITLLLANQPLDCLRAGASLAAGSLILVLALFCSVCAYLLMNTWQPRVPATEAGLIYTTEPVFTAIYVLFLPGLLGACIHHTYQNETITPTLLVGGSLIVAANVLMQWKRQAHPPAVAPAP